MRIGVVGAGIVGAAAARAIQQRWPNACVWLIDKASGPAQHQSGRNSGVIHAGVYYPPNSLKADFCRRGLEATYAFAKSHGIAHRQTGKLIVATSEQQLTALKNLAERAACNGLTLTRLSADELQRREPAIRGAAALHVKETGIVDYGAIVRTLVAQFTQAGGSLRLGAEVTGIAEAERGVCVQFFQGAPLQLDKLLVCAGLQADRMLRAQGLTPDFAIVPFRGEYFRLRPGALTLSHLVYPVPDPALPFLGVHLTLMAGGDITAGPNAVLALDREGYGSGDCQAHFSAQDVWDLVRFSGFWRLLARYPRAGLSELRDSLWRSGYLKRLQRYCPQLRLDDLQPWPVGIRAQAVKPNGDLMQDFHFTQTEHCLHVCNAPSPAATSAFPIAEHLLKKMEPWFE